MVLFYLTRQVVSFGCLFDNSPRMFSGRKFWQNLLWNFSRCISFRFHCAYNQWEMCLKFFDRLFCRFLLMFLSRYFAKFLSRFFAGSFSGFVLVPFSGSFSKTMYLAVIKAALASASRRPHRNTILPATDGNSELIIKSSYGSFCKASTSSTLTNIPIVLVKTLKKFFIKLSFVLP